jgi:hypothetical protein
MLTRETDERAAILEALRVWVNRRPGLDFADYCDDARPGRDPRAAPDVEGRKAYFAEMRQITKARRDALELLREVERRSISLETMRDAFRTFSGRLVWDGRDLSYTAGQYFPTEYRLAACAVLRAMLWDYWRSDVPAEGENKRAAISRRAQSALSPPLFRRWFREA